MSDDSDDSVYKSNPFNKKNLPNHDSIRIAPRDVVDHAAVYPVLQSQSWDISMIVVGLADIDS